MKSEYRIFVQNLRKFMDMKHINQRGMAAYLGVSTATTSDWYNGNKLPRMDKLEQIANMLDVTVPDLLMTNEVETEVDLSEDGKRTVFLMEKMSPEQQRLVYEYAKLVAQK